MQQAPPPPGSSSPQKDSGLGTTGDATRKEFEVGSALTAAAVAAMYTVAMCIDTSALAVPALMASRLCTDRALCMNKASHTKGCNYFSGPLSMSLFCPQT